MKRILDESKVVNFVKEGQLLEWQEKVDRCHQWLHQGGGKGDDFLGWVDWPVNYNKEELKRIKELSERIRDNSDLLVVVGIGGSYLGAKAVIEALGSDGQVEIVFSGNNLSSREMRKVLEKMEGKQVSLLVISKSGTTTEAALAFRVLREWMEEEYGNESNERIYVVTDKEKGSLRELSKEKKYESLVVPDNIGGRYSVLTPVGLLAIGVAGIDIERLMEGAREARDNYSDSDLSKNDCYRYAVYRNIFYEQGKRIEVLANYEADLHFMSEWWKQLFGESEGKDKKGIWPASVDLTTDLHSLGQFIQDGSRNLFETVLWIEEDKDKLMIKENENNGDGLNYLAGKSLAEVNKKAMEGTVLAHTDGGTPNLIIRLDSLDTYYLGYLIYFWQKACGMSAYLLGVNPFNQPGVEAYKKNMFALLGKPGFEKEKEELEKRL